MQFNQRITKSTTYGKVPIGSFPPVGPHEEADADFQPLPRANDVECFLSHLKLAVTSLEIIPTNAIPCHSTVHSFFLVCHRSTLAIPPMTTTRNRLSFSNSEPPKIRLLRIKPQSFRSKSQQMFQSPSSPSSSASLRQKLVIERPTVARRAKLKWTLEHSNTSPQWPSSKYPARNRGQVRSIHFGAHGGYSGLRWLWVQSWGTGHQILRVASARGESSGGMANS